MQCMYEYTLGTGMRQAAGSGGCVRRTNGTCIMGSEGTVFLTTNAAVVDDGCRTEPMYEWESMKGANQR